MERSFNPVVYTTIFLVISGLYSGDSSSIISFLSMIISLVVVVSMCFMTTYIILLKLTRFADVP